MVLEQSGFFKFIMFMLCFAIYPTLSWKLPFLLTLLCSNKKSIQKSNIQNILFYIWFLFAKFVSSSFFLLLFFFLFVYFKLLWLKMCCDRPWQPALHSTSSTWCFVIKQDGNSLVIICICVHQLFVYCWVLFLITIMHIMFVWLCILFKQ